MEHPIKGLLILVILFLHKYFYKYIKNKN
jgi:hypothetical protein